MADALKQHRHRRDDVIVMLSARGVTAPIAAAGYQLPMQVSSAADAARLAVRMENDGATAWRAVVEHAETADDRVFASTALTERGDGHPLEQGAGRLAHHRGLSGRGRIATR